MPTDWKYRFSKVGEDKPGAVLPLGSSSATPKPPVSTASSGTTKAPWYDVREWTVTKIVAAGVGAMILAATLKLK